MPKAQQASRPAGAGGFRIVTFPKEFERNIWEDIDRRFYVILLSSLAIIYGMVIYLANTEISQEEVDRAIKEKYLQKVYEAELITEAPVAEEDVSGPGIGEETAVEEPEPEVDERAERDKGKRTEGKGQSAAERAERRQQAAAARRSQRASMEQAIAGTGVLGVLSAGDGTGGSGDAVVDVLGESGSGSGIGNLDEVLGNVGGLQTASSSQRRSQLGARSSGTGTAGSAGIDDLIEGGIGESTSRSIARQGDFAISFEEGSVTGKASRSTARSAENIGRVVNKHSDAVENCYRREARINPNLKGSLTVQFTITPDGKVSLVRVLESTLRSAKVESCVKRRIRSWRFQPIAQSEGDANFRQKFIFSH